MSRQRMLPHQQQGSVSPSSSQPGGLEYSQGYLPRSNGGEGGSGSKTGGMAGGQQLQYSDRSAVPPHQASPPRKAVRDPYASASSNARSRRDRDRDPFDVSEETSM